MAEQRRRLRIFVQAENTGPPNIEVVVKKAADCKIARCAALGDVDESLELCSKDGESFPTTARFAFADVAEQNDASLRCTRYSMLSMGFTKDTGMNGISLRPVESIDAERHQRQSLGAEVNPE
jgi:hypothetical protein